MVALLMKFDQQDDAHILMTGMEEKLGFEQFVRLLCALIECYGRYGLKEEMLATYKLLQRMPSPDAVSLSSQSLVQAYASMDLPKEALTTIQEMQRRGFRPSSADFKAAVCSFGRCGLTCEMEALVCEMDIHEWEECLFNAIINVHANSQNHCKIKEWVGKMTDAGICPSVHTINALAKACPVLGLVASSSAHCEVGLIEKLHGNLHARGATSGELQTVNYLVCLVPGVISWDSCWQLELHDTSFVSAYVIFLCWLKEVRHKLEARASFPSEIVVVTGWGKHSKVRGSSAVKMRMRELLAGMKSPFMVDSKNKGRLSARPHAILAWLNRLCCLK